MIYLLKFYREIIIIALVIVCGVLGLKLQTAQYEAKEVQLFHEKLVAEANAKSATIVAQVTEQRKIDTEQYASEIQNINDKYNSALLNSNRVQSEITTYNSRLNTVSREAVENYAKTCGILYGKSTERIAGLGRYVAELNAELDKVTQPQKSPN